MQQTIDRESTLTPVASYLLTKCDELLELARAMERDGEIRHDKYSGKNEPHGGTAFSIPGFAQCGRATLATIVGNGIHAAAADTQVALAYDGWATLAHMAGQTELAQALREYVAGQDGPQLVLIPEAIRYLEGARKIIAES